MADRNIKKVAIFVGLTFFVSWLMAALFAAFGGKLDTPVAVVVIIAYMFVPMTIVIVVQKLIYKEPIKAPMGISFRLNLWFLVAWLLPPIIAFVTLGVSLLFPGVEYSPEMEGIRSILTPEQFEKMQSQFSLIPIHPFWVGLLAGLVAGVTINAVAGFGEELGWRGFLQRELGFLGFWKSSAVIGFIWGIWHAPIILQGHNYPQHPVAGVLMMTAFTLLLAPIFSYVRLKAKSVIAVAILHGSLNATAGLSIMVVKGGSDLTIGVTGLAGFIVLAIANIGIFVYDHFLAKEPVMGRKGDPELSPVT